MSPWAEVVADLTARIKLHNMRLNNVVQASFNLYLYSTISPVLVEGGSQLRCAPSVNLIAEEDPGKPGKQVLNVEISDQAPRQQAFFNFLIFIACTVFYRRIYESGYELLAQGLCFS